MGSVAYMQGRDVIATAHTGSGKTAAFALPILQKLAEQPFGVFALVLTPTRSALTPDHVSSYSERIAATRSLIYLTSAAWSFGVHAGSLHSSWLISSELWEQAWSCR